MAEPTRGDWTGAVLSLDLPEAEVVFYPAFFPGPEADRLLEELIETTAWRQDAMTMFGESKPLPRLTAWYGNPVARYVYSGIVNEPLPWTAALAEVKEAAEAAEAAAGATFNGVLLNRYRTGRDSMGRHADDEPEFGDEPVIASVSFGGTRKFQLKHKRLKELKGGVELTHGSLLVMRGGTQANWLHQVPKTARPVGERLKPHVPADRRTDPHRAGARSAQASSARRSCRMKGVILHKIGPRGRTIGTLTRIAKSSIVDVR